VVKWFIKITLTYCGYQKEQNNIVATIGSNTKRQIAGGFRSIPVNRNRAERCPPKTIAAGLAGQLMLAVVFDLI
jgi:hypothetical protein